MILLEVDCDETNNALELCRLIRDKICDVHNCFLNYEDISEYRESLNLDCLWDVLTDFNYHDTPVKIVLYNLEKVRTYWANLDIYDNFLSLFTKLHEQYDNDFVYEFYNHEIEKPTECVTLKFVKLDREYENEEEQRNYEANCNE